MKKRAALAAAILFIPLLLISGCNGKETNKPEVLKNVKVTPVQKSSILDLTTFDISNADIP